MSASRLKFLVDVGVGKKVEEYLHDENYDIKTVRSLDQRMPDQDIIRLAALEKRIVITMDKDFGELVYHSGMDHSGILLLSPVPLISHSPITPCAAPNALCFHRMKLHRI